MSASLDSSADHHVETDYRGSWSIPSDGTVTHLAQFLYFCLMEALFLAAS